MAWLKPDYIIVKGSSFLCANVTAKIAKCLQHRKTVDWNTICSYEYSFQKSIDNHIPFTIFKAAVFPFNKEIHVIARFEELLKFDITNYYTARISGCVGKRISDMLPDCHNEKIIQNIDSINWDEFDTLILGHMGEISKLTPNRYSITLVTNAINNEKISIALIILKCSQISFVILDTKIYISHTQIVQISKRDLGSCTKPTNL